MRSVHGKIGQHALLFVRCGVSFAMRHREMLLPFLGVSSLDLRPAEMSAFFMVICGFISKTGLSVISLYSAAIRV
jgi:hypothetical protein